MYAARGWILYWVVFFAAAPAQAAPVDSPPASWLAQAQQELVQREYRASTTDRGLQAPNRAQGFRTFFDAESVALVTRDAEHAPLLGLRLINYGRKRALHAPGAAEVSVAGAQVTQRWQHLAARYDNRVDGLTQELVISQRPPGGSALNLVFALGAASPAINGNSAVLTSGKQALRWDGFAAADAEGRVVPVSLSARHDKLTLTLDDRHAQYPIAVKSVLSGMAEAQLESNQASAFFGVSVGGAGDVNGDGFADVIVGAALYDNGQANEGAAFVYMGGTAAFSPTPDALLEGDQASASFGNSVAGAGDVNGDGFADVIVGAQQYDNGQIDEGAAFIYYGGGGAFDPTADAQLELNQASGFSGVSVAGAGDVNGDGYGDVIVGASRYDNGQTNEGAAFVYFGGAGAFNSTADTLLESNQASALFGVSVASAGDVNGDGFADVIVGALLYANGTPDEGAAFVYFGGTGAFDSTADAQLESNQAGAQFGTSVAGAGDVNGDGFADIIVGADQYDNGQANEGAAFIYFGGAGAFNPTADAQLESDQALALFGVGVSGAGDVNGDGFADVVVGAQLFDNGEANEGAAFVYFGGAGAFDFTADAQLESNQASASFGLNVAGAGDVNGDGFADVIVGAQLYDNGQTDEGGAFVYFGGAGVFNSTADAQLESNQEVALFGLSVAGAGDVNGDGFADVIVGAIFYDNGQTNEGAAFVYFGGAGAIDATADAQLESNQAGAQFGAGVAGAGDVNGDGFADVIVGAEAYDNGQTDEGAAFVYFGGTGAFSLDPDAQLESNQESARFGGYVVGAGDVNGDGFADVIVGARVYDNGQTDEGAAFVYFGGTGAFDLAADAQLESNQASARFGVGVAGAGDVNGDGFADVIVGADNYTNGQSEEGAAFIYFGSTGAFDLTADAQLESDQPGAQFGFGVAGAGDVNGDGLADVIVGARKYQNGQAGEGAAFVYFGGTGAFDLTADAQLESNQAGARFGVGVAGAGDVNGDGLADVIVGADGYSNGELNEGAAFVYFSNAGAFNPAADAQLESNQAGAFLGFSVAGAGDINGDGFADVIVGADGFDNGQSGEGGAFVYYGTTRGRSVLAGQFRGDGSTPVQPWGLSQRADGFVVAIEATSPRGRERARLQVEACPNGADFGSLLCDTRTSATWTEIGANPQGSTLALPLTGLSVDRVYHWRARVQFAPLTVTSAGITTSPNPPAGPWRRLYANAGVADIRTRSPTSDFIFADGFE